VGSPIAKLQRVTRASTPARPGRDASIRSACHRPSEAPRAASRPA
jgi:hypothetical protein